MPLPTTRQQVDAVMDSLELSSRLGAYTLQLERAEALEGRLRLEVLRQVLLRAQRYRGTIERDLTSRQGLLRSAQEYFSALPPSHEAYDPLMLPYIDAHLQRLTTLSERFHSVVMAEGQAQLEALEELLTQLRVWTPAEKPDPTYIRFNAREVLYTLLAMGFVLLVVLLGRRAGYAALQIPSPVGQGLVYRLGVVEEISSTEEAALERLAAAYQGRTQHEVGLVLVDDHTQYARSMAGLAEALTDAGYTPNTLLLVVDFSARQTYLVGESVLEYGDLWTTTDSRYVVEELLPGYFRQGEYAEGLQAFLEYTEEQLPESTAAMTEAAAQSAALREEITGRNTRQAVQWFMLLVAVGLALSALYRGVQRWRMARLRRSLQYFLNATLPLYRADLQGLSASDIAKNPALQRFLPLLAEDLSMTERRITDFFQQQEQTHSEALTLYQHIERYEDGFTAFINHPGALVAELERLYKEHDDADAAFRQLLEGADF